MATRESSSSSAAHRLFCCDPDHSVIQFTVGGCRDSESLSFGAEREHRGSPCCAMKVHKVLLDCWYTSCFLAARCGIHIV